MEKRMGALTAQKFCLHGVKKLMNFRSTNSGVYGDGLATIYAPNGRNRRNAFDRCLRIVFHNGWQEPLNGFVPNSHGRRVWSLAQRSLNVKVKVTRNRKSAVHSEHPATSPSLVRGVFAGLRIVRAACRVRWAWRATVGSATHF